MDEEKAISFTLRLPQGLHEKAKEEAKRQHGSMHSWLLRLIEAAVQREPAAQ